MLTCSREYTHNPVSTVQVTLRGKKCSVHWILVFSGWIYYLYPMPNICCAAKTILIVGGLYEGFWFYWALAVGSLGCGVGPLFIRLVALHLVVAWSDCDVESLEQESLSCREEALYFHGAAGVCLFCHNVCVGGTCQSNIDIHPSTQGFPAQYCIETRLTALYMPPCQFFYFHGCLSLLIILNSCGYSRLLGAGQLYGSFYLCNKFSLFLYLIHWISKEEAFILFLLMPLDGCRI